MREEIEKILTMFEEGKLEKKEAIQLIEILQEKDRPEDQEEANAFSSKMLQIRIDSPEGDDINVNIPIKLLKGFLKTGSGLNVFMPEEKKEKINLDAVLDALEKDVTGDIVDMIDDDGERLVISIK